MIVVETREQKNGFWWCNATVAGYDVSFEHPLTIEAQNKMREHLKSIPNIRIKWEAPKFYNRDLLKELLNKPYVKPMTYRIDKSPFCLMTTCFFTICDTRFQRNRQNERNLDFAGFKKSFEKFHPDIPLIVFDETDMKKHGLTFYNAKATFGQILSKEYNLVVNVDADHYFFDRCEEILSADYDIACPANWNLSGNVVAINCTSGINGGANPNSFVSEKEFLQGGLIASPNPKFWEHYEYAVKQHNHKFHCYENDVLNIVAYTYPYNVKILDGGIIPHNNSWYGCSIIGKEPNCYIENDKVILEDKPVKAYHFAHGSAKKNYWEIFNTGVSEFIKTQIIE